MDKAAPTADNFADTPTQQMLRHARAYTVQLFIITNLFASAVTAIVASYTSPKGQLALWLGLLWSATALGALWFRRHSGIRFLNRVVDNSVASGGRGRTLTIVTALCIIWGLFPAIVRPLSDAGWVLSGMALITFALTSSVLFGLDRRLQAASLIPTILLGGIAIGLLGGRPGLAAAFLLAWIPVPALALGRVTRRVGATAIDNAVSAERNAKELIDANEALNYQARHDAMTGLPNRLGFQRGVDAARREAEQTGVGFAVGFLDLDHFKRANDTLGHVVGDELLVAIARRLNEMLQPGDVVARDGGDEFICVLRGMADDQQAEREGIRLLTAFDTPFEVAGRTYRMTASLGLVHSTGGGSLTAENLRDFADQSLYEAKDLGRNQVHMFTDSLRTRAAQQQGYVRELQQALANGDIVGWYQPEVDLDTGRIVGAECLARWTGSQTRPNAASFLERVEETHLATPVAESILRSAMLLRSSLTDLEIQIAINLPPHQVPEAILMLTDVLPDRSLRGLTFEITETQIIQDMTGLRKSLAEVRGLGGRVLLDDFGTGYSSLSLITDLPIDGVKIDCSFTQTLGVSAASRAVVEAVALTARRLNLDVVAEGVETYEQAEILRGFGVDSAQGYLFAPAMTADEFEALLNGDHRYSVRA